MQLSDFFFWLKFSDVIGQVTVSTEYFLVSFQDNQIAWIRPRVGDPTAGCVIPVEKLSEVEKLLLEHAKSVLLSDLLFSYYNWDKANARLLLALSRRLSGFRQRALEEFLDL